MKNMPGAKVDASTLLTHATSTEKDPSSATVRFEHIMQWFETLTPDTLSRIASIYAEDASFRDPFNRMAGMAGVQQVYQHMFETLHDPRFVITERVVQSMQAYLSWDFNFSLRGQTMQIQGCTYFLLNTEGLIAVHRDYWDAAEELYEKLPVLGALMRFLKRRLAVKI